MALILAGLGTTQSIFAHIAIGNRVALPSDVRKDYGLATFAFQRLIAFSNYNDPSSPLSSPLREQPG
ncbi:MAG TPA: hypothetical protein DC047_13590 [Blastocatellia bacterium]|nr:hypothetical protein [Blastocatellia bacterium]